MQVLSLMGVPQFANNFREASLREHLLREILTILLGVAPNVSSLKSAIGRVPNTCWYHLRSTEAEFALGFYEKSLPQRPLGDVTDSLRRAWLQAKRLSKLQDDLNLTLVDSFQDQSPINIHSYSIDQSLGDFGDGNTVFVQGDLPELKTLSLPLQASPTINVKWTLKGEINLDMLRGISKIDLSDWKSDLNYSHERISVEFTPGNHCARFVMNKENMMDNDNFPATLHLGTIEISFEDLMALRSGSVLEVALPENVRGYLETAGELWASGKVFINSDSLKLEIDQTYGNFCDESSKDSVQN
ncbi:MAG: hypothetical protein KDD53_05020 [Bdellovibrionales bacterium]|nr:hypothetical protein [Bdellovibrionales bacterium]